VLTQVCTKLAQLRAAAAARRRLTAVASYGLRAQPDREPPFCAVALCC